MKKYILFLFTFFLLWESYSQAPQGFNYQAIVRDASGNIKANTGVQFTFKIETANGVPLYSELHTTITNKYGLTNMTIGKGISNDDFSNIKWGSGTYMLNVNIDGVDVGTTQLMSVPYALYAVSSGSSSGGGGVGISSTVDNGDGTFTLNYTDGTSFTTTNLSGKSAYQLWIDKGNTGTEEDFLGSLEPVTLENTKYLSLNGQQIVGKTVPIIAGGTGAITAIVARSNLGVDVAGTDNSTNVTLGGTSNYLTISGQQIIRGKVDLSNSVTGTLPISKGGTGGTTAEEARTALGIDGLEGSDPVTLENTNYLSLNGQELKGNTIPIIAGGTGAVNATAARSNLGVDVAGTDNSTNVTLGGTSNYLTISGQEIIRGKVNLSSSVIGTLPISQGGTGGTTAEEAKTALGIESSTPITLENTNYLSLNGQEIKGNTIPIIAGGTGAVNATAARSNLGVDVAGTDNSTNVTLGGTSNYLTISGQEIIRGKVDLSSSVIGTLPISQGGTGAVTAEAARAALGLDGIQTNVTTDLSTTTSATTLTVVSSDGTDAVLPVATTSAGGVMSTALFDEVAVNTSKSGITSAQADAIIANTAKVGITTIQANAILANTAKTGITSAQASAITANTAKETNVSTNLSTSTSSTTLTVASSDGTDAVLPVATTSAGGVMSAALFDEVAANTSKSGITSAQADAIIANTAKVGITTIQANAILANTAKTGITSAQASAITANTAKETNVSTNLSTSTSSTTLTVASSDGTDAVLPVATTSAGGVMSAALFDEVTANTSKSGITSAQASAITANTAKETNVSTNLSTSTSSTTLTVASSDGTDAVLPVATTSAGGVMSAALFDEVAANTAKTGITSSQATTIANLGTISTQDANAVNIDGGAIDGVTIGTNGVVTQAVIDNINIDGATIGHTGDTDLLTLASGIVTVAGEVSLTTLDIGGTNVTADAGELNIMDGNTSATSTTVVDADRIVLNDDGTMKQVAVTDLSTYLGSGATNIDGLSDGKSAGDNFTGSLLIGHQTTGTLNAATYNTAVGLTALDALTTGDHNTAIGYNTLTSNTTGNYNTASGNTALQANTSGFANTASGYSALYSNKTGAYNTASGYSALYKNISGDNNTASGYQALNANTTGDYNTASGYQALKVNTTGTRNIAIGALAYDNADTENDNLAIGYDALGGAINGGEFNVAIGNYSLDANTVGDDNVAVGYNALTANTTGGYNAAIGSEALYSNTTGGYNAAIGSEALYSNTTGGYNAAIGSEALYSNTTGGYNTASGSEALYANTTGAYNTASGYRALYANTTGISNTAIGYKALFYNTTGFSNTALGINAGNLITTGTKNILLGHNADPSANNGTNQIVIGYGATGLGDNIAVIGNTDITAWVPADNNGVNLGDASKQFKDLFIDGTANLDAVDIDAGAIDGTVIGANAASTGAFTTVTASTSVDITGSTGLILENDETITNSTDGTVSVGGNLSGTGSISGFDANLNDQTGTTYTLASSDNGKVVALNNGSAITLTVPTSLGDGFNCLIVQKGAGQVTIAGAGGVTLQNGSSQYKTYARYSIITLVNIGSELYIVSGDTGS